VTASPNGLWGAFALSRSIAGRNHLEDLPSDVAVREVRTPCKTIGRHSSPAKAHTSLGGSLLAEHLVCAAGYSMI
jgi:hypothetical protein